MLDCKPVDTPMDPNVKLVPEQGEPLSPLALIVRTTYYLI